MYNGNKEKETYLGTRSSVHMSNSKYVEEAYANEYYQKEPLSGCVRTYVRAQRHSLFRNAEMEVVVSLRKFC